MIKITKANQNEIVSKRNEKLPEYYQSEKEIKALSSSCIGLNYNNEDQDCKDCENKDNCIAIENYLKGNKEAKPVEVKEIKTVEAKVMEETKDIKVTEHKTKTVESVVLKFDYNKLDVDVEQLKKVKHLTRDIKRVQNSIVSDMIAMGEMLNRAKIMVDSHWLDWLAVELDMSANQAYSAITVYNRFNNKIGQISNKIAYTTLGQLATDAYTDEEIEQVLKAVDHEKIPGTLSSIQNFVKELRLSENKTAETKDKKETKEREIDTEIDISDEDISFKPFIKEAEAFLKILESSATVSEEQFNDLHKLKDIIKQINDDMEIKLTEIKGVE